MAEGFFSIVGRKTPPANVDFDLFVDARKLRGQIGHADAGYESGRKRAAGGFGDLWAILEDRVVGARRWGLPPILKGTSRRDAVRALAQERFAVR